MEHISILPPPDYILKKQKRLTLREAHEFTRCVTRSLVLCVCFVDRCLSFVLFLLAIVLSVLLRFTESDYILGIFKLFLRTLSCQAADYEIGICCFSATHAASRRKSKGWLVRNQNNVCVWSEMSIRLLLFL